MEKASFIDSLKYYFYTFNKVGGFFYTILLFVWSFASFFLLLYPFILFGFIDYFYNSLTAWIFLISVLFFHKYVVSINSGLYQTTVIYLCNFRREKNYFSFMKKNFKGIYEICKRNASISVLDSKKIYTLSHAINIYLSGKVSVDKSIEKTVPLFKKTFMKEVRSRHIVAKVFMYGWAFIIVVGIYYALNIHPILYWDYLLFFGSSPLWAPIVMSMPFQLASTVHCLEFWEKNK